MPSLAVYLVGGQDELVFDGASCVLDAQGKLVRQAPFFEEALALFEFNGAVPVPGDVAPELPLEAEIYQALVLGTRDYIDKNGFPGAVLGLSGGVDSALTLAIACDALGAARVHAVMMPSQYTARMSLDDAAEMARRVGVRYDTARRADRLGDRGRRGRDGEVGDGGGVSHRACADRRRRARGRPGCPR
jgi:NAD+ synthase (glutamine-hydrolysing)